MTRIDYSRRLWLSWKHLLLEIIEDIHRTDQSTTNIEVTEWPPHPTASFSSDWHLAAWLSLSFPLANVGHLGLTLLESNWRKEADRIQGLPCINSPLTKGPKSLWLAFLLQTTTDGHDQSFSQHIAAATSWKCACFSASVCIIREWCSLEYTLSPTFVLQ